MAATTAVGGKRGGPADLSKRELDVLRLIAQGESNAQAAERLGISALTVKKHLERMYAATGTRNRAELISFAFQRASDGAAPWLVQPRPAHNLPAALTSFVGRERQVAEASALLAVARLVTLAGPGGVGKTRLAIEVGTAVLDRFRDGVWLVELASLADPRLVAQVVSSTLGVPEGARARLAALTATLRTKELLVVLDNCEHLVASCAELSEALLRSCPGVRVLATSRETLNVDGEVFWQVPVLGLPGRSVSRREMLKAAEDSEAVRLFVDRARLRAPQATLTAANAAIYSEICRRLDGLPLAIELAAARMNVLSVEEISQRLDDRFRELRTASPDAIPRHRTLRGAIDWSYRLLGRSEATLFERQSVFAGGCTLDAVAAVCADDDGVPQAASHARVERGEVLELLARLVDRSFVIADTRQSETRYRILETLHEYARERFESSEDADAIRARHAAFYLDLAERAEPHLRGPEQLEWFDRLEADHDNLRAALVWSWDHDAETAQRLAGALWRFWFHRGHGAEGLSSLERALALTPTPPDVRGKALNAAGNLADFVGDAERSEAFHRENLALQRRQPHPKTFLLTGALSNLGDRLRERGAVAEARPLYLEALGLRGNDTWGLALSMSQLGHVALDEGDLVEVGRCYLEALSLWRRAGDHDRSAGALGFVARWERERGRYDRAAVLLRRALIVYRALGDRNSMARTLADLAVVAAAAGDLPRAARMRAASTAASEDIGAAKRRGESCDVRALAPMQEAVARGELADEWAAGLVMPLDAAVDGELVRLSDPH